MAYSNITGVSNTKLWDLARKASPKFASHTAKATADLFTEKGFEALRRSDIAAINEFFEISMRIAFQAVTASKAKNLFESKGLVEIYDTPNGGYVQRMAIESIKPISPAYKGLKDGDAPSPFVVRKPNVSERFFAQNFDYQSLCSIQDFQVKNIFINEYGMGEFLAGIMQALQNGYTIQKSLNTKKAISKAIDSTTYPLQDTQKVVINVYEEPNWQALADGTLQALILAIKQTISAMTTVEQTGAYNAMKFKSAINADDTVILMRSGIRDQIDVKLEVGAFNPDRLSLPGEIIEVDNFGGLRPYVDAEVEGETVRRYMQPVYDKLGEEVAYINEDYEVIGYANYDSHAEKWGVTVDIEGEETYMDCLTDNDLTGWEDPYKDIVAILCEKGLLFENVQNPYEVTPIYNPRGMYNNFWANSPNNSIVVDPIKNMVLFTLKESE